MQTTEPPAGHDSSACQVGNFLDGDVSILKVAGTKITITDRGIRGFNGTR